MLFIDRPVLGTAEIEGTFYIFFMWFPFTPLEIDFEIYCYKREESC
jgi:hypothetical protein